MATRAHPESKWPLKAGAPLEADNQPEVDSRTKADWSAYAATYDLLLEHNPAYQDLLDEFQSVLSNMDSPQVIYDIGGGTGNYTQIAAEKCPDSSIYLLEPDRVMTQRAKEKLSAHENIVYIDQPLQEAELAAKADLVICVHALYTMPEQEDRLVDLKNLLKPGGVLFLIDLGRPMNVADWRSYLFSHLTKKLGIAKALQILWKGREIAKQNKAIFKAQKDGLYWTHTESEMRSAAEKAGFEVTMQKTVYRGYSDLLLCRAAS